MRVSGMEIGLQKVKSCTLFKVNKARIFSLDTFSIFVKLMLLPLAVKQNESGPPQWFACWIHQLCFDPFFFFFFFAYGLQVITIEF